MLSSLVEIMNRERALSFSAALCLLTVSAAALPGLFQEDDPFKNASLWEGNSLAAASSSPELSTGLELSPPIEIGVSTETFVNVESESFDFPEATEDAPKLEIDFEPVVDSVETIELLEDHPSPNLEASELELNNPGILEVSVEAPALETELIESASQEIGFDENTGAFGELEFAESELAESEPVEMELVEGELVEGELVEGELVEAESEADSSDRILDGSESYPVAAELETQLDSDSQLEQAGDSDQGFETEIDTAEVALTQDSDQDTLLAPAIVDLQSDENVFRGELWVAPPTSEAVSSTPQASVVPPSDSVPLESLGQSPEFMPLPIQVYPEYDWSQSPIDVTDSQAIDPVTLNTPLTSPQLLSGDYQPFAAGNPALGGSVEYNPLAVDTPLPSLQPELKSWPEYSDMVMDIPQQVSVDRGHQFESFARPTVPGVQPSQPDSAYQGEDYGAYAPVCACPSHDQAQPALQAPQATQEQCLKRGLSRFRLRSFKLCPCRHATVCHECGQPKSSHGLIMNWFYQRRHCGRGGIKNWLLSPPTHRPVCGLTNWLLQPPTHRPVCGLGKWLLSPPTHRPVCGLTNWLLQPPTRRPACGLGKWLLQPPTRRPVCGLGKWLLQPPTATPVRNLRSTLFNNPVHTNQGLPSRLYNGSNSFS